MKYIKSRVKREPSAVVDYAEVLPTTTRYHVNIVKRRGGYTVYAKRTKGGVFVPVATAQTIHEAVDNARWFATDDCILYNGKPLEWLE